MGDAGAEGQGKRASLDGTSRGVNTRRTTGIDEVGAAPEARIQSFRVLLTPLTYLPVGHIDIETCEACSGMVKIIAPIDD